MTRQIERRDGGAGGEDGRGSGYMQSLIARLQHDVDARKRARTTFWPGVRLSVLCLALGLTSYEFGARSAAQASPGVGAHASILGFHKGTSADAMAGTIDLQRAQIERLERAFELSSRYDISAALALTIEEIALAEGVEPDLAFELVRLESNFNPRAVSSAGALGLAQLMPATARILAPEITRAEIFDPETNLRLGFRFFRSLLDYYDGDVRLALLAYNRGPTTVDRLLAQGIDPANGYARIIMTRRDRLP